MVRIQNVALLNLSITQLQAKAAELYRMADGARTADTRDALRRLAIRFTQLAATRAIQEVDGAATIGPWSAPPSPEKANSVDG
jgi:hypothetical protein